MKNTQSAFSSIEDFGFFWQFYLKKNVSITHTSYIEFWKQKLLTLLKSLKTWYYQNLNKSVKYFISTSMICDKLQAINFSAPLRTDVVL